MFRLPDTVTLALDMLESAGFEAYAVGGCVRDLCRGVLPHDYDITTSATPGEIEATFDGFRLIETGIKHGTVTVLVDGEPLEITTYRTDGKYLDNRHPSSVTFSRDIADDLSRRDFTVNAMAYSPRRGLCDIFGGRRDIERRVIECVGEPAARFDEDGLRILRAIRFASCLGFTVGDATKAAIHEKKSLLSNISAERILSELRRMLTGGGAPSVTGEFSDVIEVVMPEVSVTAATVDAISRSRCDLPLRFALLLDDLSSLPALARLKPEGKLYASVKSTLELARGFDTDDVGLRRVLRSHSYDDTVRAVEMMSLCGRMDAADADAVILRLREMEARGECVNVRMLDITGADLIGIGIPAGKRMGEILDALLEGVITERVKNERGALLLFAEDFSKNG